MIVCTGTRIVGGCGAGGIASGLSGSSTGGPGGQVGGPGAEQGRQALAGLAGLADTSKLSDAQVMQLGEFFLGVGENYVASGDKRDAVVVWGFGTNGFAGFVAEAKFGENFTPEIQAIFNDRDVREEMLRAWHLSNPYGSYSGKDEHGFWIGKKGSDYFSYGIFKGEGDAIWAIENRPRGSEIFFHTHPFTLDERHVPGISSDDLRIGNRNEGALVISYGHGQTFEWYDGRKR